MVKNEVKVKKGICILLTLKGLSTSLYREVHRF